MTGYYDKLYISEFFFKEENKKENNEYFISPETPLSFILNKVILEEAEYDTLQRYIQNQLKDGTSFVYCIINVGGRSQHFTIPKEYIIRAN